MTLFRASALPGKSLRRAALLLSIPLTLTALSCKKQSAGNGPNVVRAHVKGPAPSLHPINALSATMLYVFDYIHKTPTRLDLRTNEEIPVLVTALGQPSADKLSYSYTLRDDVRWDDGKPLTVDDIIFTMKVSKCPLVNNSSRKGDFDNVKDIVKAPADPHKFSVQFKSIHYKNQNVFDFFFVVEKSMWDAAGALDKLSIPDMDTQLGNAWHPDLKPWADAFNAGENGKSMKKIQGLGPYAVTDWQGNTLTLTRKENWWGKNDTSVYNKAYPDRIIFEAIPEENTVVAKLRNHTLDVCNFLSTDAYLKMQADTAFSSHYYMGMTEQFTYNVIALNTRPQGRTPFFEDVKVRRAMALLTPVDAMNHDLAHDNGTRQASFIEPALKKYYNDKLPVLKQDVEQAKRLLDDAGWKDSDGDNVRDKMINGKKVPFSFEFTYGAGNKINENIMLSLRQEYAKAGIQLKPVAVDLTALMTQVLPKHNYDMGLYALSGDANLDDPAQLFLQKNWTDQQDNVTGFGNESSDKLIAQIDQTLDDNQRAAMVKQLQEMVYDYQPYIYLYAVKRKCVISKRFDNPGMYAARPGLILNNLKLKP